MNAQKQRSQKKTRPFGLLAAGLVILLLVVGSGACVYHRSKSVKPSSTDPITGSKVNYGPATAAEKQAAQQQKLQENNKSATTTSAPKTISISSLSKDSSGEVVVQTKLNGTGWQSCMLTLSRPGATTITLNADVLYQASYSTCEGFTVKANQFTENGTWTVVLTATNSNGATSTSDQETIAIGP